MTTPNISPSILTGMHTRTKYNSATGKIVLAPAPIVSTNPNAWSVTGAAPTYTSDAATIDNTDSTNRNLWWIYHIDQALATAMTLRAKITAENIATPEDNNFSLYMYGSYNPAGGTADVLGYTQFPPGTWPETQFSLTLSPTSPITYIYAHVYATNKTGKITVRDIELYTEGATAAVQGEWASDPIDLMSYSVDVPLSADVDTPISLSHLGFYYGNLSNVDNQNSVTHGKETLKVFNMLVTHSPDKPLNAASLAVVNYLIAQGVQVYGYTASTSSDAVITAAINSMAAGGYYGVFFDEAGYDWAVSRTRLNTLCNYAHSKGLKFFANSWTPSDVLSSAVNATYNPGGTATAMTTGDWVLLESFYTRGDNVYAGVPEGGFLVSFNKYTTTTGLATPLGVNVAGLAYHMNTTAISDTTERDRSYLLACILGLKGWAYGGTTAANSLYWKTKPYYDLGSSFSAAYAQITTRMIRRESDRAVLWLSYTDSPAARSAGVYRKAYEVPVKGMSDSSFTTTRVTLSYETSADLVTWAEWTGQNLQKYIRGKAVLET